MIISAMQPYFFPSIHYFQLIKSSDIFVILDNVNYINRGFINRNYLINSQTKKKDLFNITLKNKSQNKLINQILVLDFYSFLKKVEVNYSKVMNFNFIYNELLIKKIFNRDYIYLIDLLKTTIVEICNLLKIKTKIVLSSSLENFNLRGQERIINIVHQLNGSKYINFIGGNKIYEAHVFREKNIELNFLRSELEDVKLDKTNYFLTNISILEILMNFNIKYISNNLINKFNLLEN
jgi:hypothetical protein